jgi:UDP-N-acetylmuramoylalanine--D-glutamate ligase
MTSDTPVVLELSSFQLEHLAWQGYSPPLAVVLNLTPNHLDRHGTMAAYEQAKAGILAYQTPDHTVILNGDDAAVRRMADGCGRGQRLFYSMDAVLEDGVYRDGDNVMLARNGESTVLFHQSDLSLRGEHNLGNAAAAAAAAACLGVPPDTMAHGLRAFRGLPHRLEWIATKAGVQYYNDSKATTPLSTIRALEAFEQPLILLAGGYDKGAPFDALAQVIHKHAKAAVLYGATAPKLKQAMGQAASAAPALAQAQVLQSADLDQALRQAVDLAMPGDIVLLSPACASYDQFPHYEARGAYFRALVEALAATEKP